MSYGATLSFDLKNASSEDYQDAYADVKKIGFATHVEGENGKIALPSTTCYGKFTGASADAVMEALRTKVSAAFILRKFTYEIFIAVGGEDTMWGWKSNKPAHTI